MPIPSIGEGSRGAIERGTHVYCGDAETFVEFGIEALLLGARVVFVGAGVVLLGSHVVFVGAGVVLLDSHVVFAGEGVVLLGGLVVFVGAGVVPVPRPRGVRLRHGEAARHGCVCVRCWRARRRSR
jgi:hypothetical protein